MEYSINQLAKMAGVTTRTLRHYDQIGLLAPARVASSGYRIYTSEQADRLQQILFYRAAGMELAQIGRILDDAGFDAQQAMQQHLERLLAQRAGLDALIQTARKSLQYTKGETEMNDTEKFEGFKQKMVHENEEKYGAEVREKYGDATVDASNARMLNMSKAQYDSFVALGEELNETLRQAAAQGDAAGEKAQRAADLHKQWLQYTWPHYSADAHWGLAQMYVEDERFAAYYETIAPGGAAFLRDALKIYLGK